jgi:hypothetical protein
MDAVSKLRPSLTSSASACGNQKGLGGREKRFSALVIILHHTCCSCYKLLIGWMRHSVAARSVAVRAWKVRSPFQLRRVDLAKWGAKIRKSFIQWVVCAVGHISVGWKTVCEKKNCIWKKKLSPGPKFRHYILRTSINFEKSVWTNFTVSWKYKLSSYFNPELCIFIGTICSCSK